MVYVIGVSSGMFGIVQPQEKLGFIDLAQKGSYGMFKGVNFTQIDLERSTEFSAPKLRESLTRLRNLNISYGIHGLTTATGSRGIFLDSAVKDDWQRTQEALVRDIRNAIDFETKYYLQHASETTPYGWLGKDMQPSDIVDCWGRPLHEFLSAKENFLVLEWLVEQPELRGAHAYTVEDMKNMESVVNEAKLRANSLVEKEMIKEGKLTNSIRELKLEIPEDLAKWREFESRIQKLIPEIIEPIAREHAKGHLFSLLKRSELVYGAERIAYMSMAKWMSDKSDPLWKGVVGNRKFEDIKERIDIWVPAVSLKYIYGHFFPEEVKGSKYDDPKKEFSGKDFIFVIETGMVSAGTERECRLTNPAHFVILCKEMESKGFGNFRAAIDFEHCLGAGLKPIAEKEEKKRGEKGFLEEMIPDGGKYVGVLHVGWPTAVEPAHVPIYMGSEQQEWLYEWMYLLRKKGFNENESRYIVFERGGGVGGDPVDQSTMALKKIVEFLQKDVPPEELTNPENIHFYGVEDSSIKMQEVEITEHFMEPIKGLLQIPEEQHGFLGSGPASRGKGKEWDAGKMR